MPSEPDFIDDQHRKQLHALSVQIAGAEHLFAPIEIIAAPCYQCRLCGQPLIAEVDSRTLFGEQNLVLKHGWSDKCARAEMTLMIPMPVIEARRV
jgi:hypothetical protein